MLLVALGATGKWSEKPSLRIINCATGLVVSGLWLIMQAAALRRVIAYEGVMRRLEDRLNVPKALRLLPQVDPETDAQGARYLPRARDAMPIAPPIGTYG